MPPPPSRKSFGEANASKTTISNWSHSTIVKNNLYVNTAHPYCRIVFSPDDLSIFGPFLTDLLTGLGESFLGGLTTAVYLVSRYTAEVWHSLNLVLQLLDLLEMVGHGHLAPDLGIFGCFSHFEIVFSSLLLLLEHKY